MSDLLQTHDATPDSFWKALGRNEVVEVYESGIGLNEDEKRNVREFLMDHDHLRNTGGTSFPGKNSNNPKERFARMIDMVAAIILERAMGKGKVVLASDYERMVGTSNERLNKIAGVKLGDKELKIARPVHRFDVLAQAGEGTWLAIEQLTEKDRKIHPQGIADVPDSRGPMGIGGPSEVHIPKLVFPMDHQLWLRISKVLLQAAAQDGRHVDVMEAIITGFGTKGQSAFRYLERDRIFQLYSQAQMEKLSMQEANDAKGNDFVSVARRMVAARVRENLS